MTDLCEIAQTLSEWSLPQSILTDEISACDVIVKNLDFEDPIFEYLSEQHRTSLLPTLNIELARQSLGFLNHQPNLVTMLDVCFWGQGEHAEIRRLCEAQLISVVDFTNALISRDLYWCDDHIYSQKEELAHNPNMQFVSEQLHRLEKWVKNHNSIYTVRKQCLVDLEQWLEDLIQTDQSGRKQIADTYFVDELELKLAETSITFRHGLVDTVYLAVLLDVIAKQDHAQNQYLGTYTTLTDDIGPVEEPVFKWSDAFSTHF